MLNNAPTNSLYVELRQLQKVEASKTLYCIQNPSLQHFKSYVSVLIITTFKRFLYKCLKFCMQLGRNFILRAMYRLILQLLAGNYSEYYVVGVHFVHDDPIL